MKKRQTTHDICKKVTDIIVDGLNKDICPWIKPWASSEIGGAPHNYNSKKDYHGSNTIIFTMVMMSKGYQFNSWVTYNGAKQLGGSVKRGEKGTPVVIIKRNRSKIYAVMEVEEWVELIRSKYANCHGS